LLDRFVSARKTMGREPAIIIERREAKGIFSTQINTDPRTYSAQFSVP
jgi:hypothetical protein